MKERFKKTKTQEPFVQFIDPENGRVVCSVYHNTSDPQPVLEKGTKSNRVNIVAAVAVLGSMFLGTGNKAFADTPHPDQGNIDDHELNAIQNKNTKTPQEKDQQKENLLKFMQMMQEYNPSGGAKLVTELHALTKNLTSDDFLRYSSIRQAIANVWGIKLTPGLLSYQMTQELRKYPDYFAEFSLTEKEIKTFKNLPNGSIVVFQPDPKSDLNKYQGKPVGYVGVIKHDVDGNLLITDTVTRNFEYVAYALSGQVEVFIPKRGGLVAKEAMTVSAFEKPSVEKQFTETQKAAYLVNIYRDALDSKNQITGKPNFPTEQDKIAFMTEVIKISHDLNPDNPNLANQLVAAMYFESGLRPDSMNPNSSATGLIQFMEYFGMERHEFAAMSPLEQLKYVKLYLNHWQETALKNGHGRFRSIYDVYMAILWPAAVGQNPDFVIMRKGDGYYEVNSGLDTNRDGVITVAEAGEAVVGEAIHKGEQREVLISSQKIEHPVLPKDVVLGSKPPEYLQTAHEYLVKIHETFGINLSSDYDKTHLEWIWEALWSVSNTKFALLTKDMRVVRSYHTPSEQVGCSDQKESILLYQYQDKDLFISAFFHEAGHVIDHCAFGPSETDRQEYNSIYHTEGSVSQYGKTAGITEDYADLVRLALYRKNVQMQGSPPVIPHPFYDTFDPALSKHWAYIAKVLGLKGK